MGATMMCSFGLAPSSLVVLPIRRITSGAFAANIGDVVPMGNIPPFGACTSLTNPQVAAATSAALGVLTPQPCIPVPAGMWAPGSAQVMIGGMPALDAMSKLMCSWAGVIQVVNPGQTQTIDK